VTEELPALKDEDVFLGGLQNIIDYLRQKSSGKWDLDHEFNSSREKADITAYVFSPIAPYKTSQTASTHNSC